MDYFEYWYEYIQEHGAFRKEHLAWVLGCLLDEARDQYLYEAWEFKRYSWEPEDDERYIGVWYEPKITPERLWTKKTFDRYDPYMLDLEKMVWYMPMAIIK